VATLVHYCTVCDIDIEKYLIIDTLCINLLLK